MAMPSTGVMSQTVDIEKLLPDINMRGVYMGRFRDRNPELRAAGRLTVTGAGSASDCLQTQPRPVSPDDVRRFRATVRPDYGQARVFYGRANDPQRQLAFDMVHGINTDQREWTVAQQVNPAPSSRFRQALFDRLSKHFVRNVRAPLGRSYSQKDGLPKGLDPVRYTFGEVTERHGSVGELVNPNKNRDQVEEESEVGRELYEKSHADFLPGEQKHRGYKGFGKCFNKDHLFGLPTPHENDGRETNKSLRWLHTTQSEKATPIVSKRVDDFRERTQPQLGKTLDPIKDTLKVPEDYTFGILQKVDKYGAGDLMHYRTEDGYLRGKDRIRGLVASLRQLLKKANYQSFSDLLTAFQHYDRDCSGKIDIDDLRNVCNQLALPAEPQLLAHLMAYCDANQDGKISYLEFANFLNWRDKLPSGLVDDEQLKDVIPAHFEMQIDPAIGHHSTSSGMINSVVGGVSTRGYRTYGVPSVRTDLAPPRFRRIDDRRNFGELSDMNGLLHPSIYSTRGVFEEDFFQPRSKLELQHIFEQVGVQMTPDNFDSLYYFASKYNPKGEVSVESFRNVLDETQYANLQNRGIIE